MRKRSSTPSSVKGILRRALASGRIVRVERLELEDGHMDGRVVGLGDDVLVLHLINDDIVLNGFVALRIADLTSVASPAPYASFITKVLRVRGGWVPFELASDRMSWSTVLQYAAERWPLMAVHSESTRPDVVFIGQMSRPPTGGVVSLRLVGADGRWKAKTRRRIRMSEITRIDFGGLYEEALAIGLGLIPNGPPGKG